MDNKLFRPNVPSYPHAALDLAIVARRIWTDQAGYQSSAAVFSNRVQTPRISGQGGGERRRVNSSMAVFRFSNVLAGMCHLLVRQCQSGTPLSQLEHAPENELQLENVLSLLYRLPASAAPAAAGFSCKAANLLENSEMIR